MSDETTLPLIARRTTGVRRPNDLASGRRNPEDQSRPIAPGSSSLQWMTIGLALLADLIFTLTDADGGRSSLSLWNQVLFEFTLVCTAAIFVDRQLRPFTDGMLVMPLLILVVLISLLWEPIQRVFLLSGRPFEMMVMHTQKNLMLAMAVAGGATVYQRLSVVSGVAIAIFCSAITREHRVHWLIAIYGFAVVSWMIGSYWQTLQARLISGESRRLPLWWMLVGPSIPLLMLLASATGGQSVITALRGFLPGSGGNEASDPYSRGGVNDGEALVAGTDNIKSFGPIEDAPFADDDKPSLYDVMNDTFDEPVKKSKHQDRTVALPAELMAKINARMARSEQAGREFSTLRRRTPPDSRKIRDLESHTLFYVAGRTPLHLRMEVYDVFDGIDWIPEETPVSDHGMAIVSTNGKPWLRVPCGGRGLEIHAGADTHAIKIINLRSPVIPAPLDLRALHIDKVDEAELFGWYRESIVQMKRQALPEMTTIQLRSECMDQTRLGNHPHLNFTPSPEARRIQLPALRQMDLVRALALDWTRGIDSRYAQIEAIREQLRTNFVLDRTHHAPQDSEFPVGHFLFESQRGPDYQFATAATLMLRSLGFSTRVISGFYVSPDKYDARHRHSPVRSSDVHFWCEVYLGGGTWATLDPSPGFEVLGPPPNAGQRLWASIRRVGDWLFAHWLAVLLVLTGLLTAVLRRRHLLDALATLTWQLKPAPTARGRVLQTVRLVDRRLRFSGRTRPKNITLGRWLRQQTELSQLSPAMTAFATLTDWAAFGSHAVENEIETQEAEACCQSIRRNITLRNCRPQSHIRSNHSTTGTASR
jgi:protein-glutamine gamma-glutamyltransferase